MSQNTSRVFYVFFDDADVVTQYLRLFNKLPGALRDEVLQYKKPEDRFRNILGKLLIEYSFNYFGMYSDALSRLQRDDFKRPFVATDVDFNISHSGNCVVCAFASKNRVGIDIEKISPLEISEYDQILHPDELKEIDKASAPMNVFYEIWTQKEAVAKADGRGLEYLFKEINTCKKPIECSSKSWQTQILNLDRNYMTALACDSLEFSFQLQQVMLQQL